MCVCVGVVTHTQVYYRVPADDVSAQAEQFGKSAVAAQHAQLLAAILVVSMMSVMLHLVTFTLPPCLEVT